MIEPLLTPEAVAELLSVSPRTLEGWRQKGKGPPWHALTPGCVRYRRADIYAWLDAAKRGNDG